MLWFPNNVSPSERYMRKYPIRTRNRFLVIQLRGIFEVTVVLSCVEVEICWHGLEKRVYTFVMSKIGKDFLSAHRFAM